LGRELGRARTSSRRGSRRPTRGASGPVLGGLLISKFTVAGAYLVYAFLVAISTLCIASVRARFAAGARRRVTVEAIREGVSFVRHHQAVLGAMTLDMFAVMFGGARALLPVFAIDVLHADDPAAAADVPAWCRMREQGYLGSTQDTCTLQEPDQASYLIRILRPP